MSNLVIIFLLIIWFIVFYVIITCICIYLSSKRLKNKEAFIIELFFNKLNKFPALIEIMKKYVSNLDIFEEMIYLHKLWIIYNIKSVYDLLDLNNRINKEFNFFIQIASKTNKLYKNWNFTYIRNYIVFYESQIESNIKEYNLEISKYNKLIQLKNTSIIWLFIPIQYKINIE